MTRTRSRKDRSVGPSSSVSSMYVGASMAAAVSAIVSAIVIAGCSRGALRPVVSAARAPVHDESRVAPKPSSPRDVAVTVDDLGHTDASVDPELSSRILFHLREAHAPVAVFVNCAKLRDDVLSLWLSEGATVGNHTDAHLSLDDSKDPGMSDAWWRGVQRCHDRLSRLLGRPVQYFRYPFLAYGSTVARKQAAADHLHALGYRIAHVTAATSEWLLARYYDVALHAGDAKLASDVATRYVEHMVVTLAAAEHMSEVKLGRDVKQITLLHVNRLAADHLGQVLVALAARGWHFVSLADALSDPVYARPDEYVGGCACSWLARIAPPLTLEDDYVFGDYENRLRAEFGPRVAALEKH